MPCGVSELTNVLSDMLLSFSMSTSTNPPCVGLYTPAFVEDLHVSEGSEIAMSSRSGPATGGGAPTSKVEGRGEGVGGRREERRRRGEARAELASSLG